MAEHTTHKDNPADHLMANSFEFLPDNKSSGMSRSLPKDPEPPNLREVEQLHPADADYIPRSYPVQIRLCTDVSALNLPHTHTHPVTVSRVHV